MKNKFLKKLGFEMRKWGYIQALFFFRSCKKKTFIKYRKVIPGLQLFLKTSTHCLGMIVVQYKKDIPSCFLVRILAVTLSFFSDFGAWHLSVNKHTNLQTVTSQCLSWPAYFNQTSGGSHVKFWQLESLSPHGISTSLK